MSEERMMKFYESTAKLFLTLHQTTQKHMEEISKHIKLSPVEDEEADRSFHERLLRLVEANKKETRDAESQTDN